MSVALGIVVPVFVVLSVQTHCKQIHRTENSNYFYLNITYLTKKQRIACFSQRLIESLRSGKKCFRNIYPTMDTEHKQGQVGNFLLRHGQGGGSGKKRWAGAVLFL